MILECAGTSYSEEILLKKLKPFLRKAKLKPDQRFVSLQVTVFTII